VAIKIKVAKSTYNFVEVISKRPRNSFSKNGHSVLPSNGTITPSRPKNGRPSTKVREILNASLTFFREHPDSYLTIRDLCAILGISEWYTRIVLNVLIAVSVVRATNAWSVVDSANYDIVDVVKRYGQSNKKNKSKIVYYYSKENDVDFDFESLSKFSMSELARMVGLYTYQPRTRNVKSKEA